MNRILMGLLFASLLVGCTATTSGPTSEETEAASPTTEAANPPADDDDTNDTARARSQAHAGTLATPGEQVEGPHPQPWAPKLLPRSAR